MNLTSLLTLLSGVAGTVLSYADPSIKDLLAKNPTIGLIAGLVIVVANHFVMPVNKK